MQEKLHKTAACLTSKKKKKEGSQKKQADLRQLLPLTSKSQIRTAIPASVQYSCITTQRFLNFQVTAGKNERVSYRVRWQHRIPALRTFRGHPLSLLRAPPFLYAACVCFCALKQLSQKAPDEERQKEQRCNRR